MQVFDGQTLVKNNLLVQTKRDFCVNISSGIVKKQTV